MLSTIVKRILNPYRNRSIAMMLIDRFKLGTYGWRASVGAVERPAYGYCTYHAATLAKKLGYDKVSVLEMGVAGGQGLIALERHAELAAKAVGIDVEVYGFDTGEGLPHPSDYRDLPYHWKGGFYRMDVDKLKGKLRQAKLVLGDIGKSWDTFVRDYRPAPIGAVMFDLDFYSSTTAALRLFDANEETRLPRVLCYFDDVLGTEVELYNDYTGVRLAIREFNESHDGKKISPAYHLLSQRVVRPWYNQVFTLHDFFHSRYNQFVSELDQQLPLGH